MILGMFSESLYISARMALPLATKINKLYPHAFSWDKKSIINYL
jgi:hypothetical protein